MTAAPPTLSLRRKKVMSSSDTTEVGENSFTFPIPAAFWKAIQGCCESSFLQRWKKSETKPQPNYLCRWCPQDNQLHNQQQAQVSHLQNCPPNCRPQSWNASAAGYRNTSSLQSHHPQHSGLVTTEAHPGKILLLGHIKVSINCQEPGTMFWQENLSLSVTGCARLPFFGMTDVKGPTQQWFQPT